MSDPKRGGDEFELEYTQKWRQKRCFDGSLDIDTNKSARVLHHGNAEGRLIGANLGRLTLLQGTQYMPDFSNCILMIEAYMTDPRGLLCDLEYLEMVGCFDSIQGVIIGTIAHREHSSVSHYEILGEFFARYKIPVMGAEIFGHYQPHACIPLGAMARMSTEDESVELLEAVVR